MDTKDITKGETSIKSECPKCGKEIHDGTGTGWEICKNPMCDWIG